MMLEAFVLSMCVGQWNCQKATEAYYAGNKELQAAVIRYEKYGEKAVGEEGKVAAMIIGPAVTLATHKTASVKLSSLLSIEASTTTQKLVFKWTF